MVTLPVHSSVLPDKQLSVNDKLLMMEQASLNAANINASARSNNVGGMLPTGQNARKAALKAV